jgi:hypothetical protein
MRVTKEIAEAFKEIGYDVPTNAYYIETYHKCHEISTPENFNEVQFYISAPTVYEAIEFTDRLFEYVHYLNSIGIAWWATEEMWESGALIEIKTQNNG